MKDCFTLIKNIPLNRIKYIFKKLKLKHLFILNLICKFYSNLLLYIFFFSYHIQLELSKYYEESKIIQSKRYYIFKHAASCMSAFKGSIWTNFEATLTWSRTTRKNFNLLFAIHRDKQIPGNRFTNSFFLIYEIA